MPIKIQSHNVLASIDSTIGINQTTGKVLQGEKDMYERIVHDCEASPLMWYMWYDKSFNIQYAGQNEIQIDFLLICCEGAIIVEVKGGLIEIIRGHYYYSRKGILTEMTKSPFEQANHYKWALINNGIIDKKKIYIDYVCAFPHSSLTKTSDGADDLSYKLWNKLNHDSDKSFADFCLDVIRRERTFNRVLSDVQLKEIIDSLMPTIEDRNKFSLTSLKEVLQWLHIDNLNILEGLRKNLRIVIEGGPGTGKTTMAKAYIKRHSGFKGIYLCWTSLLASKVNSDLKKEGLYNCDVSTYNSFVNQITPSHFSVEDACHQIDFRDSFASALKSVMVSKYDYIIIDEAQDIADKGVDIFLNRVLSTDNTGLSQGRYLVFYDLEQGYNRISRKLDEFVSSITEFSACFVLDENKRVPTNKLIVDSANKLFSLPFATDSFKQYLQKLKNDNIPGMTISFYQSVRSLKKAIKSHSSYLSEYSHGLSTTTLLIHSDLKYKENILDDSVFESISEMDQLLVPLTDNSINHSSKETLLYTTILKYKGLEDSNIILVLPQHNIKSSWENFIFEVYVGMTRAIMNLDILILEEK